MRRSKCEDINVLNFLELRTLQEVGNVAISFEIVKIKIVLTISKFQWCAS